MASPELKHPLLSVQQLGRTAVQAVEECGYVAALLVESLYWVVFGSVRHQPVRLPSIFSQMMTIGIGAIPIVFVLSFAVGVMLAIQGIHTLRIFGAESQVVIGIALSVTREFGPLITGVLIAGRSGSALAAQIGTMQVSQEIDALRVMGINPVRYLVSPALLAMLIMVPTLTFFSDLAALFGGAVYSTVELGLGVEAYLQQTLDVLAADDIMQGLIKSVVFAGIIALVGVSNGFSVTGGAEGVGRATTRAVVLSISYIVLADMVFTYFLNR
ncbi:MAG: ABC transporter permease [Gammaproteobacteria bacterium]|nr:ABC transporter permease [Gammaproteobacteria bacterium]MCI0590855.1 ABC transporter permease [Gammaproteobacteria bacterium]